MRKPRVFMLYMPPSNVEAMVHFEHTIQQRVPLTRIAPHVPPLVTQRLKTIFGEHDIPVWGSQSGPQNQVRFDAMAEGDVILIVVGNQIRLLGKAAGKTVSKPLSKALWQPLRGQADTTWELIYFIANPVEIDLPFVKLCELFAYAKEFQLRGFSSIGPEKLEAFYAQYDDLYSVLMRLKSGQPLEKQRNLEFEPEEYLVKPPVEDPPPIPEASDHTRMQYLLSKLGKKAGERIWVPPNDQNRIQDSYDFTAFDKEFTTAIDLPKNYVENIDVVWKQEYRVDAAYEVENSTSIYSGLLRFADLAIMAPNSSYPMFIVAPNERRGRVRDQLARPAFRELGIDKRVLFLPYEAVEEIDRFFESTQSGLTVDVVKSKSVALHPG